jgi:hypothetical protein
MLRSTRRGLETRHGRDGVTLADERASPRGTQTSTYTDAPVLDPTGKRRRETGRRKVARRSSPTFTESHFVDPASIDILLQGCSFARCRCSGRAHLGSHSVVTVAPQGNSRLNVGFVRDQQPFDFTDPGGIAPARLRHVSAKTHSLLYAKKGRNWTDSPRSDSPAIFTRIHAAGSSRHGLSP